MEQLEKLLGRIQPEPSHRFHERMEKQPWNRDPEIPLMTWFLARKHRAIILVSIFMGFIIILVTPSLDVVANRIAQFFTTSPTDQVSIEIPIDNTQHQVIELTDTVLEVSQKAGFSINE